MNNYIVLYVNSSLNPVDPPLPFTCEANSADHAEELCEKAWPGSTVVWTTTGMTLQESLDDYWGIAAEGEIKQPHCPYCQSTNLVATANAAWDVNKQEWMAVDILDDIMCQSCNQEFKTPSWNEVVYGKPEN